MRESENGEEGERRTPEGEGDGELLPPGRASERDTETKKEKFLPPLLVTEIPSRERERGGEGGEVFLSPLLLAIMRWKFRLSLSY